MKYLIIIFIIMFLFGCSTELPKGYEFLCSKDGSKVALKRPSGKVGANVWKFKCSAAAFARYWEKYKSEPFVADSSEYEWGECERE